MTWRSVQLGTGACNQDNIILELFNNKPVRYLGSDIEFSRRLNINDTAPNLILILNHPLWCSDIVKACCLHVDKTVDTFYIGINRYTILGNDTNRFNVSSGQHGTDIIKFLDSVLSEQGFCVTKSGSMDNDLGYYFNFVQPLTWIYGTKVTVKSI